MSPRKEDSFIHVQRAAVYAEGRLVEKDTKTKAGYRTIPIEPREITYNILMKAKKQYLKEQSGVEDFQGQNLFPTC